jgi:outer membrane protein assembly factor BamB
MEVKIGRRTLLKYMGATAAAGATGCLGEEYGEDVVWASGVAGNLDVVRDGVVYGGQAFGDAEKRSAFGLGARTGDVLWKHGEIGGSSTYTQVVVDGGVYFGYGDDEVGSGAGALYALDTDGGERWVREVGSIYDAPVIKGGVVYVGSDGGKAYAFGAETGKEIWNKEFESPEEYATPAVEVEAVEDGIVYVTAYGNLYEIDEESGGEIRRHDGDRFSGIEVSGGTVYASQSGRIVAYEDGDELWRYESVGVNPRIRGAAHGNVYFGEGRDLVALDAAEGKRVWSTEIGKDYPVTLADSSVYFGERDLHAVSPDGDELWSISLEGSSLDGLSIAGGYVYAVTEDNAYRTKEGEVLSSVEVPAENVRNHAVGEYVYVGTDGGVYALDV